MSTCRAVKFAKTSVRHPTAIDDFGCVVISKAAKRRQNNKGQTPSLAPQGLHPMSKPAYSKDGANREPSGRGACRPERVRLRVGIYSAASGFLPVRRGGAGRSTSGFSNSKWNLWRKRFTTGASRTATEVMKTTPLNKA